MPIGPLAADGRAWLAPFLDGTFRPLTSTPPTASPSRPGALRHALSRSSGSSGRSDALSGADDGNDARPRREGTRPACSGSPRSTRHRSGPNGRVIEDAILRRSRPGTPRRAKDGPVQSMPCATRCARFQCMKPLHTRCRMHACVCACPMHAHMTENAAQANAS